MMMGLRLNIELKGSVPPRDHLHQTRQWACYLQTDPLLGLNTLAGSVVKNDAEEWSPVVINNVNLLLPLYGDKKSHFYI